MGMISQKKKEEKEEENVEGEEEKKKERGWEKRGKIKKKSDYNLPPQNLK